ncbi:MAG TPA: histidine phosphatase family protein [Planctomycetota bacterium]|nr:histidine phosphatase family protein [Planctomycetota bacterium]
MSHHTPAVYLVRHGETEWARDGRHTGLSDIPLTAVGEQAAKAMTNTLNGLIINQVWTSPLQRAKRTCELAGFGAQAQTEADLVEWNYGDYEGRRSAEIHRENPTWSVFRDGCPNGEMPAQIGARADRLVARLRTATGATLIFSSGHLLRALAARWLGLPVEAGSTLALSTASLSVLGYEHSDRDPVILLWNQQQR